MFKELQIVNSYTLESSFHGTKFNYVEDEKEELSSEEEEEE